MTNDVENPLVYVVVRYGHVVGVYRNQQDAMQVVSTSVAKGKICDLFINPLM